LRAVTPAQLEGVVALAGGGPVHIHAAEQTKEVEDCVAWSGKRPVEWLLDTQNVDERWCVIHATHMTPAETQRLANSGAVAGLCPVTEANLGDGIFNGADFAGHGGCFGVGTDSNVHISLPQELRQLEYGQRLARRERNVLARAERQSTGRQVFDSALQGGAQAMGLACHGLQRGALADVVSLDAGHPALSYRSGDAWLDGWLFASDGRVVETVWSLGRKVVIDGRHIHREPLRAQFAAVMAKVLAA
jgi:formimidoylglutamate deiminase